MLCLFRWKTFYKNNFPHFPVYGNIKKKINQRKTIFSQQKTLIKIKFIFYKLFSKKKKKGKQSLSHAAHNSYKHYILLIQKTTRIFSIFYNKLSYFLSSLCFFISFRTLTITSSDLFSSHRFLSLSASILFFLPISSLLYNIVL